MANKSSDKQNNNLWKIIGVAGNSIWMNLTFLICCLPVITIGSAFSAMYTGIRYFIRGDSWIEGFKDGFKNNFFRVTAVWTVCLAIGVFVANDIFITVQHYSSKYIVSLVASCVILAIDLIFVTTFLIYNVYFPGKFVDVLSETASFMFSNILFLIICAAITWAPVVVFFSLPGIIMEFLLVFLGFYFSVSAFGVTIILKKPLIKVLKHKNRED